MKSKYAHIFVYGSLLSGLGNHQLLVRHQAISRGEHTLKGYYQMLDLGGFPGLIKSEKKFSSIKGELYTVNRAGLQALDALEGHPRMYKRTRVAVWNALGQQVYCQTYIFQSPRQIEVVESGDWRQHLEQKNKLVLYFAYGSNMDADQMIERCPSTRYVGTAVLPKHRLAFTGYSAARKGAVATVLRHRRHEAHGIVWLISQADLLKLDRFEGTPNVYKRSVMTVELEDSTKIDAFIYKKINKRQGLPSADYVQNILNGYRMFCLDAQPVTEAIDRAILARKQAKKTLTTPPIISTKPTLFGSATI